MEAGETLGTYAFFPRKHHYVHHLKLEIPPHSAQKAILKALFRLNGHEIRDTLFNFIVGSDTKIILEVGVADGLSFDYLNIDTLNNILRIINERPASTLDFLCIVKYYRLRDNKRVALRFDFFLLRFLFHEGGEISIHAFHERGLQRIHAEELISFLIKEICLELFAEKALNPGPKKP